MKENSNKILFLQGLKGIAAMVVVIFHFISGFYPILVYGNNEFYSNSFMDKFSKSPLNIFYNGNLAVSFFFLIGAYVISYKYFKEHKELNVKSVLKKYFRFVIPVFVSIFIAYILMKFGLFYNTEVAAITHSNWLGPFYQFVPSFFGMLKEGVYGSLIQGVNSYNPTLWTMHYELFGAFLVFLILAIVNKMPFKKRLITYAFIILLLFTRIEYLAFVYGVLIADVINSDNKIKEKIDNKYILLIILLLGMYFASVPNNVFYISNFYRPLYILNTSSLFWHNIGGALLMTLLFYIPKLKEFLSNKWFVKMGDISFSMYLMHFWIQNSISCFIFIKLLNHFCFSICFGITLIITLLLLYIVTIIFDKYIEKPSIKFANKVYDFMYGGKDEKTKSITM